MTKNTAPGHHFHDTILRNNTENVSMSWPPFWHHHQNVVDIKCDLDIKKAPQQESRWWMYHSNKEKPDCT